MTDEVNVFATFGRKILYFIGWLIKQISGILQGESVASWTIVGFDSPLVYLSFGIFLVFASLHIFKRFLRKG